MIRIIKKIAGKLIRLIYHLVYKILPVNKKTILFISFHGRGYSDNPKAIFEYINKNYPGKYNCVWAIKHHKKKQLNIPDAKIIEYFSFSYFYYLAISKYWVVNCKLPSYIVKKSNQIYLQTWHGTPLKKLAYDIEVSDDTRFYRSKVTKQVMLESYGKDVARYNYMISPSNFTTEVFQSAFRIDKERLIETGYPRNDFLTNHSNDDVIKLKQNLGIPLDKKVILYAPTWRDNSFNNRGYTFKLEVNFNLWYEKLKDEYVVIFKPHYLITNTFDLSGLENFVYYVDSTKDISDLYVISDLLVTDYSSVFFDFAILNKPIYFYMYDLASYRDELRGFYLDIYTQLPGDVIEKEDNLLDSIKTNLFNYQRLARFNEYFNSFEDGKASKRVVDILFGVNSNENK